MNPSFLFWNQNFDSKGLEMKSDRSDANFNDWEVDRTSIKILQTFFPQLYSSQNSFGTLVPIHFLGPRDGKYPN